MDFRWSKEEQDFENEVNDFAKKEVTVGVIKETWEGEGFGPHSWGLLRKLGEKGWLTPQWPKEYGGLASSYIKKYIIIERLAYHGFSVRHTAAGIVGPVILKYGNEEQKRFFLPKIARGEIEFALGYTEPEAGSDLGSLQMRAVRHGNEYVIDGQKIYNTRAHYAQYHWLMVRTNPKVPKHKGLSLLIVDLKTPGITVSGLKALGNLRTNQVFYDSVHVPVTCLVGEEDHAWGYLMEALDHERIGIAMVSMCDHLIGELIEYCRANKRNGLPLAQDPLVRQKIAEMAIKLSISRMYCLRAACMIDRGQKIMYESAAMKVFNSEFRHWMFGEGMRILGMYGPLKTASRSVQLKGELQLEYESSIRDIIGGGADEILKTLIAVRGLGLPTG